MDRLPTIFVSHGSPMVTFMPQTDAHRFLSAPPPWPRPAAILAVSAHWETATPAVQAGAAPATLHDYGGGFPEPALYTVAYPARGDARLADTVRTLLGGACALDHQRGYDHGAWAPLRLTYPQADIPVVQLSIQPHLGPAHHLALGRALAALPGMGVLVYASGTLVHNLRDLDRTGARPTPPWARGFAGWVAERMAAGEEAALLDYRRRAPDAAHCHPTEEHLLPLFVALGAAGPDWHADRLHASFTFSTQCMDCYAFGARA